MKYLDFAVFVIHFSIISIIFLFLILITIKMKNILNEKISQYYNKKYEEYYIYMQSSLHCSTPLFRPHFKLSKLGRDVFQEKIIKLIHLTEGKARNKLVSLCKEMGLVDLQIKRLSSRNNEIMVNAAYNLGAMHVEEAVPELLKLLNKKRYQPIFFIIITAIVRCTKSKQEIIEMIQKGISNYKDAHALLVEIIEVNCRLEVTDIFLELLHSENPDMIKIALIGLFGSTDLRMTKRLNQLIQSEEKETRIKAVKALIHSGDQFYWENMINLLESEDWEIRASAAKAIGIFGFIQYIDFLKKCLKDRAWWVRYNSAKSLILLGGEGFQALCEAVMEEDDSYKSDMALYVIQEELKNSPYLFQDEESVMRFNEKLYFYQKFFGKRLSYDKV